MFLHNVFLTKKLLKCVQCHVNSYTVYVPIDAHCASADLRVRVYF